MRDQNKEKFIYRGGRCSFMTPKRFSTVEVDPSITSIDDQAFENWPSLMSITIPSNVTLIGCGAFFRCPSLTTLTLPSTITSIGSRAFSGCSSLSTVLIPTSVTSIEVRTFYGCSSLVKVNLPPSVTIIKEGAFEYCTSLASVHFDADPICISLTAFSGCHLLTTLNAPSFSTKSFNTNTKGFRKVLVEAGYSVLNRTHQIILDNASSSRVLNPDFYQNDISEDTYFNMGLWARTRSAKDMRLPLYTAVSRSLDWASVRQIFKANMPAIQELDIVTGLPSFMLAAVGTNSKLEATYNLLREYPPAIVIHSVATQPAVVESQKWRRVIYRPVDDDYIDIPLEKQSARKASESYAASEEIKRTLIKTEIDRDGEKRVWCTRGFNKGVQIQADDWLSKKRARSDSEDDNLVTKKKIN